MNAKIASLREEQSDRDEDILLGDDGKEKRETITKFLVFCTADIHKEVSHIPHAYKPSSLTTSSGRFPALPKRTK